MNISSNELEIFEQLWVHFFINSCESMEMHMYENQIY